MCWQKNAGSFRLCGHISKLLRELWFVLVPTVRRTLHQRVRWRVCVCVFFKCRAALRSEPGVQIMERLSVAVSSAAELFPLLYLESKYRARLQERLIVRPSY